MENQQESAHVKPLSLVDMSSAFVVLGLGISLSILVFLIELIYKRIKDHYFTDHEDNEKRSPVVAKKEVKAVKPAVAIKKRVNDVTKIRVAPAIAAPVAVEINQANDIISAATADAKKVEEKPTVLAPVQKKNLAITVGAAINNQVKAIGTVVQEKVEKVGQKVKINRNKMMPPVNKK